MPADTPPHSPHHRARRRLLQACCLLALVLGLQAALAGQTRQCRPDQRFSAHASPRASHQAPSRHPSYLRLKLCLAGHACAMSPPAGRMRRTWRLAV